MNNLSWLEISKSSLIHNLKQFKKIIGSQTQLMAVVKSNAYGHGLVECAKIFAKAGADWLGVVNLDEALALKKAGIKKPVMVLSYFDLSQNSLDPLTQAIKKGVRLPVYDLKTAKWLSRIALKARKTAYLHVKIDTGTSRLGVLPSEAVGLIKRLLKLPNLRLEGVFSHLADSENPNQTFTNKQIDIFEKLIIKLEKQGINIPLNHLACSAATILNKRSWFNLVRVGISLYGLYSIQDGWQKMKRKYSWFSLKPALSWYTKVIQIKELPAGTSIGYGLTYKTKRQSKIAVLPFGYWEGYDRKLSNSGKVLIHGQHAPVRGRVCMNMTMIDITDIPNVRVGDRVTLIGCDGKEEITTEELAKKIGTINYEVVTRINPLLKRVYK